MMVVEWSTDKLTGLTRWIEYASPERDSDQKTQTESELDHHHNNNPAKSTQSRSNLDSVMPGMMHHGSHRGNVRAGSTMAGGVDRATDTTSQCGRVIRALGLNIAEFIRADRCDPGDKVGSEGRGGGVVVEEGAGARGRQTDGRGGWRECDSRRK